MHAAAARRTITFEHAVTLSGSGDLTPVLNQYDPIEVQAIKFEVGHHATYIVTLDVLSFGQELRNYVEELLPSVSADAIICCASHTHSAPAVDPALPKLGPVTPHALDQVKQALSDVIEDVESAVISKVDLFLGQDNAPGVIYRRKSGWHIIGKFPFLQKSVRMRPNPDHKVNTDLHALVIYNAITHKPVAVLWTCACHPTGFFRKDEISADFPGQVRDAVRDHLKAPALPVLFLQGFCGDLRPDFRDLRKTWKARLKRAIMGETFQRPGEKRWHNWCDALSTSTLAAITSAIQCASTPSLLVQSTTVPLNDLHCDLRPCPDWDQHGSLRIARIKLAGVLNLVTFNCEPSQEYVDLIPQTDEPVWAVGYTDHIFGYLPTDIQRSSGGYETDGFRQNFSLRGTYVASPQDVIKLALRDLF